ncbi:MAG: glycosyltransferase family 4 protein [Nitrospiria bacterium]
MSGPVEMRRLLYLSLGPYFRPDEIPIREKYRFLSTLYCGDIIAVIDINRFNHRKLENFKVKGLYLGFLNAIPLVRTISFLIFAVITSVYSHYFKNRYDVVIAGEPLVTGLLALTISKLTRSRCIVEVNGNFNSAFKLNSARTSLFNQMKQKYARIVAPFILRHADGVKLLYKDQLNGFGGRRALGNSSCFADFVPISQFKKEPVIESKYILFLGYPWYLKGVDVLIKAFKKMSGKFPDYSLKIVGYCPDQTYFRELAGDNQRIEFCDPVWYEGAIKLISQCSLFVLPSRTEAMGRVLLEAMASKKPIIASNVDGVPTYIRDGQNGLLFESENVDELAEKICLILSDKEFSGRLAENGFHYVFNELSEEKYLLHYQSLIESVLTKNNAI